MRVLPLMFGTLLMTACSAPTDATGAAEQPAAAQADTPAEPVTIRTSTLLDTSGAAGPQMVRFRQTAPNGLTAEWLSYGATLARLTLPDGTDVTVGLPSNAAYTGAHPYVGATVGRVANRIGGGAFEIDGERHAVKTNEGANVLHAGPDGLDRQLWSGGFTPEGTLVMRHSSPDGHQGYPGRLDVEMEAVLGADRLRVTYRAQTTKPTPVNLTLHGYWDPSGAFDEAVDSLTLQSPATRYTVVGDDLIPTGESADVAGTDYDFRDARAVGSAFIDVNALVPGEGLREMARLTDGTRTITVLSDYPGLQIYSGEALEGAGFARRGALALEPQYPPDAVNRPVDGEDTVLRPGETYEHVIEFRFTGPDLP